VSPPVIRLGAGKKEGLVNIQVPQPHKAALGISGRDYGYQPEARQIKKPKQALP
jgi:hypothetical protein